MPRRIVWPKTKKIWWCYSCNIPVLQHPCPICGGKPKRLSLSEPGDARPAFDRDYKSLYSAYIYEFGTSKGFNDIVGKSVALLNKAPYYDEMKEIIVDGIQIGRLFFDPLLRKWRFRLSMYTAVKLYSCYPDILETVKIKRKRYLHADIIRTDSEIDPKKQVLLIDDEGNVVGIGYSRGQGRVMVHSWWGAKTKTVDVEFVDRISKRTNLNDVIRAHEDYIRIITAQAKKFVSITYEKIRKPVIVSFSGGKDSLVSLHLSLNMGLDPIVLFNNTGIELPETVATVYRTVEKYGLKLIEASAEDKFWEAVYGLGVPGRDYRWCCKVCKLAPLSRTVKELFSGGGLNIVGQRAFESIDRARSPRLWRLRWAPTLLNLSPINEWSQFEIWLYIFMHNLEPNPLYFMGYERIGCFMCPASTLAELELVSQTHKELWGRWVEVLRYWAKKLDLPSEWIDYGLWRWNVPSRYRTMIAKRLRVNEKIDDWLQIFKRIANPSITNIENTSGNIKVVLEEDIELESIKNQITTLNPTDYFIDRDKGYIKMVWDNATLAIVGRTIEISIGSDEAIEKLIEVLKIFYRWRLCTGCRSCETICPSGAITLKEINGRGVKPVVDKSKCTGCKFCIYNCPVAEVYVEHVIAPIIFNDPEAWRRKTREHHAEVLNKIRRFVKSSMTKARPTQYANSEKPSVDISAFFQMEMP